MQKAKKRPSKKAKEALKIVSESKLLAAAKASSTNSAGQEFRAAQSAPRTAGANKLRPEKKKG